MHAVGAERERRLDVVVDDERDARRARGVGDSAAPLDDLASRQVLEAQLDHGRAAFDRTPRRLGVLDDAVELHASEMLRAGSSASGVSA